MPDTPALGIWVHLSAFAWRRESRTEHRGSAALTTGNSEGLRKAE